MNKNTGSITGLSVNGKSNGRFGLFVVLAAISTMAFAGMAGYASADPGISAPSVSNSVASLTNSTAASVTFSSSETRPYTFECSTDGSAWTLCTSPQTLTGLADGSHSVQVRQVVETAAAIPAVDPVAGSPEGCVSGDPDNGCTTEPTPGSAAIPATYATSDVASTSWTVDATKPGDVVFSGTPANGALVNVDTTSINISSEGSSEIRCAVDNNGSLVVTSSPIQLSGLRQGAHTISCLGRDAAGNDSNSAQLIEWTVDTIAPPFGPQVVAYATPTSYGSSDLPANTSSQAAYFQFSGSVAGENKFVCSLDGAAYAECASPQNFTDLTEAAHSFSIKTVDAAGNIGPATTTNWTVDKTAPAAPQLSGVPASLTNSKAASIGISAEDHATFTCSVDGGDYAACTSPKALSDLTDGNHSISVKATDRAGNTSVAATSSTWEVDGTAPVIALGGVPSGEVQGPGASGVTNAKKPAWFFTLVDAAGHLSASTATCRIDSGTTASACTSPYQAPANLSDGSHTLTVTVADSLGNTRTFTNTFTEDTIAPTASIIDGPSGRSGASVSFHLGSTEDGSTFRCRATGANAFAWRACDSTLSLTGLSSGGTTLYVQATDPAGNQSLSVSKTWAVAAEVPTTVINYRTPTTAVGSYPLGVLRVGNGEFRFLVDDPLATTECKIDDEAWADCTSPYTYSGLGYGDHTFSVRATNDVGTVGAARTSSWTVASEPDTAISAKPNATTHSDSAAFEFSSAYPDATFQCKLDSGAWTSCESGKSYSSLALLGHTFQVRAINQVGEPDLTPATYSWSVVAIPDTAITTSSPGTTFDTSLSVAFSSAYPGATFQCSLDNAAWATCTSPKALSGLSGGAHTFRVRALNSANEADETPASLSWTVSTPETTIGTKPAAAITARTASFTFTSDASGATFECKLDAAAWAACTSPRNLTDLAIGSHTFQVRASKSGSTDATPASYTFAVNAPNTTITANPAATDPNKTPSFSFTSDTTGATFECAVDSGAWAACTSPFKSKTLSSGSHTFKVRASAFGTADATPASYTWTIGCPTYAAVDVSTAALTVSTGLTAQVRVQFAKPVAGDSTGIKYSLLLNGGAGTTAQKTAFGAVVKSIEVKAGSNTTNLTSSGSWAGGFKPASSTSASDLTVTVTFKKASGTLGTKTITVHVNPACS